MSMGDDSSEPDKDPAGAPADSSGPERASNHGNEGAPVSSPRQTGSDRWSRRSAVIAGLGVLVAGAAGGVTWFFSARADEREERAARRDQEWHEWELPPRTGSAVKILGAYTGEFVPFWPQALVSKEKLGPEDFRYGEDHDSAYRMVFARGGYWYGRMSVDITIESLRRNVLINGAEVKVRSLGAPPDGTIFAPAPYGGPGEQTEILQAGINLDAPRPVVRTLSPRMQDVESSKEAGNVKNNPIELLGLFPSKQVTLGAHDMLRMRVLAEARAGCYEWEFSLDIFADSTRQSVPIKVRNFPLRIAAPVDNYQSVLQEQGHSPTGDGQCRGHQHGGAPALAVKNDLRRTHGSWPVRTAQAGDVIRVPSGANYPEIVNRYPSVFGTTRRVQR